MQAAPSQLASLVARLIAQWGPCANAQGDSSDAASSDTFADIFACIEEAALRNLAECIANVHEVLDTLPQDHPARIPCLKGLAHALCYENRFEEALTLLDQAIRVAQHHARTDDLATLELTRVQPLERLGKTADAEEAARAALRTFEARNDAFNAGRAMVNLGVVRRVRGQAADALAWFEKARVPLAGHPLALGTLETNAAEAMLDLDRCDQALESFARSRTIFEREGHTLGAAIAEGNLADVYSRLGRIDEATLSFARARALFAASNCGADASRLLAEEAQAYATVGADWRALDLFDAARAALSEPGMRLERIVALLGEGLALLRIGSPERALRVLTHARDEARDADAAQMCDDASLALARALLETGQLDEAQRELSSLQGKFDHRPIRHAQASLLRALALLRSGQPRQAQGVLAACEADCAIIAPLRAAHAHARARVLHALGDLEAAWQCCEAAMSIADAARAALRTDFLRATFLDAHKDLHAHAMEVALALKGDAMPARVFALVERVRARALADACAGRRVAATDSEIPSTNTAAQVASLSRTLATAYAALAQLSPSDPAAFATQRNTIRDLESNLERATHLHPAQSDALDALAPLSLDQARASLDHGHVALVWFRHGDALGLLVLSQDAAHLIEGVLLVRDAATLVRRQVVAIDFATNSPSTARPNPSFDALCRVLKERVAPLLARATHVAIVPSPEVFALPMAPALLVAAQDIAPGLTAFLAPSISSARVIAKRSALQRAHRHTTHPNSTPARALVVAIADEAAPQMEAEARAVAALYNHPTTLLGPQANADAFLAALRHHDVVHIACHCEFDPQFPMASRLKLADRWVPARELFGQLCPGCVVVLAGCESGRTSDTLGEDRQGLVRALLVGGASMVVASQWRLHDAAAERIFPTLHQFFVQQLTAAPSAPAPAMAHALSLATRDARHLPWHAWQGLFAMGGLQ